jgi:hypothetical protein
MSSASYTNRIRTSAQSTLNKVQYPGRTSISFDQIRASCNINPDYTEIIYTILCCKPGRPFTRPILDGGTPYSGGSIVLNGGTPTSSGPIILNGGSL